MIMNKFKELKESILADGVIDEQEVQQLREIIYADGNVDKEEADFLFELNDAVSGAENHSSWELFFVKAISAFLLDDPNSPGELDNDEVNWLLEKVQGDGKLDNIEYSLLMNLKSKVTEFPQALINIMK